VAHEQVQTESAKLADVIDRILDKGVVINADITIDLVGVHLLDIRIRAALASFETAAKYGLEFPSQTDFEAPGWKEARHGERLCLQCGKHQSRAQAREGVCHRCGWTSLRPQEA